jgi:putative Ca2+/H+ antiporter (TMEM165/GDT1 family)
MVVADGLAIGVGKLLGSSLPERWIRVAAAIAFVVFGVILLYEALT